MRERTSRRASKQANVLRVSVSTVPHLNGRNNSVNDRIYDRKLLNERLMAGTNEKQNMIDMETERNMKYESRACSTCKHA